VSPIDPLLSWVVLDGNTEKSDTVTLRVSQIIPPAGFLEDCYFTVYQEPDYGDDYYAAFWFVTENERQLNFAMCFNVKFTGQGNIAAHMSQNPMFYMIEDFPYLWRDIPHVPVYPPYGTAQFVIGNHPDDSRYFFGPVFTVDYEEG
jgi:hypothetical protein